MISEAYIHGRGVSSIRQVVPPIGVVQKIMGSQKAVDGALCRLSMHCMCVERREGVLLYHTMTGEILLLTHEEAALLGELPGPVPAALAGLVPRWFLRPVGTDDMALADQVRAIAARFRKKDDALTRYKIFTTTDCNARCFYCYEAGWKKSSMTDVTARSTAKYISEHCGGRPVSLEWYGGEPLVNASAIDIITDCLRRNGVNFRSRMISNGYLFDEALVRRARAEWNMERIQITLDGTEDVYNKRKAYVNSGGSPYRRVFNNIGLLLDAGISVRIRLNMDEDNEEDLYVLCDELAEQFADKPGFDVYPMTIWENAGRNSPKYTEEERISYAGKLRSMNLYAEKKGMARRASLNRGIAVNACLADNDKFASVTPDGLLGRCSACMDSSIWGSVFSDDVNEEVLGKWRERKPPEESCRICAVYPVCIRLKRCPNWLEQCSPVERFLREEKLRRAVLTAYEDWKAAGQS